VQANPFKVFRLACLVAGGQHKISKNGKKYGVLTLEDFTGKFDLTLFGDVYIKYSNYFDTGNCLYITGKFEKWESRNEWNFRVAEICLLETIKRALTRQLLIDVQPKLLKEEHIQFIERNVKRFPGKASLKFTFTEPKEHLKVSMYTVEKGFEMNDEMAAFLEENQDLDVNVVTA
jgi:DNA polymerase-3 subunit alpha